MPEAVAVQWAARAADGRILAADDMKRKVVEIGRQSGQGFALLRNGVEVGTYGALRPVVITTGTGRIRVGCPRCGRRDLVPRPGSTAVPGHVRPGGRELCRPGAGR